MENGPHPSRELRDEEIEAERTFIRIAELDQDPVLGIFDASHLKEIHRRIFQDLPGLGVESSPDNFRPSLHVGQSYRKSRVLSDNTTKYSVVYSPMDEDSTDQLNALLSAVDPGFFARLNTRDFVKSLADFYGQIDQIHPFSEGNSRTLRAFTEQLANQSGFQLRWDLRNRSESDRDDIYRARDRVVNEITIKHVMVSQSPSAEQTIKHLIGAKRIVSQGPDLAQILTDIVRPTRAVAYEKLSQDDSLSQHPELAATFEFQASAQEDLLKRYPSSDPLVITKIVRDSILDALNKGQIENFQLTTSSVDGSTNRWVKNNLGQKVDQPPLKSPYERFKDSKG